MLRAVLLMLLAMSLIPLGDSAAKTLINTHGVAPVYVVWVRFALGAVVVLPFLPQKTRVARVFTDWRILFRALIMVCGISSIMVALKLAPLPSVYGAFFVGPMISYALSVWFLGEKVTLGRTLLLALGFLGVLLVVKPGAAMNPGLLFALLAGCFYGIFLTSSRWLAGVAPGPHLLFSQLAVGGLVLLPFGLPHLTEASPLVLGLLAASALCSMAGNLLLILAYGLAPATRMAPLVYVQLIAASAYGWTLFNDRPDALTWLGMGLLVATGFAALLKRA